MSNIADYWGELPPNMNGLQEWGNGQNVVGSGYMRLMLGKVIGYPHMEAHHITSTYNVALIDMHDDHGGEIIIHNCSQLLPNAGLDYTGVREPLMDGTPVLLLCKDGVFDQAYILGCIRLSGDYDEFILKGNVPKPFSVGEGWQGEQVANPGPSFPYVVARPEDYVRVTAMDNLVAGFGRPEYEQELKGKARKRPQPGSVEIRTMGGDVVNYCKNTFAIYADRQVVILALSGSETKCTALAMQASYYADRYEALKSAVSAAPDKDEKGAMLNWNTGKPVGYTKDLDQLDRTSLDWGEPMGVKYHLNELYKLSQQYRAASAACNSSSAATSQAIASTEKRVQGKLLPLEKVTDPKDKIDPSKVRLNKAKPKESKTGTPPQGSRAGIEVDEVLQKLGDKAPDAMTIQKVGGGSNDGWDEDGDKPLPMASTIKLQVADLATQAKLPPAITITQEVLGEGEESMLGKSYSPEQLVRMALRDSNNTATNALVRAMAGEGSSGIPNPAVGELLRARGYEDTTLANYLSTTTAQGRNTSTTNDVTRAMGNLIEYDGPMSNTIREAMGQSETPFNGARSVDGVQVIYNKVGGTSTTAANSAVIEVDGSKYIVTTTKQGVSGTTSQGDAVSDASLREAITQIRGLSTMGGPSNETPVIAPNLVEKATSI